MRLYCVLIIEIEHSQLYNGFKPISSKRFGMKQGIWPRDVTKTVYIFLNITKIMYKINILLNNNKN